MSTKPRRRRVAGREAKRASKEQIRQVLPDDRPIIAQMGPSPNHHDGCCEYPAAHGQHQRRDIANREFACDGIATPYQCAYDRQQHTIISEPSKGMGLLALLHGLLRSAGFEDQTKQRAIRGIEWEIQHGGRSGRGLFAAPFTKQPVSVGSLAV